MNSRENSSNYRPLLCSKRKVGRNYPKKKNYKYLTNSCALEFTYTNILDMKWKI